MGDLPVPRPTVPRGRWRGFAADVSDKSAKALHEIGNDQHRLRAEHDNHTIYVHLSGEDGKGWTTMAVDRQTRAAAIGQADTQTGAAMDAARGLYGEQP